MLNLNQLAQFLCIARTGSLAAAAEELGLSSAALSKSLSTLERQLGTKLFDRVGRGLQLTRVGQRLVAQAAELLGHVNRVSTDLRSSADGSAGTLSVGCGPAALHGPVSQLVHKLVEPSPQVQLRIESGNTGDLLEGLRQYRLDFVIADAGRLPVSGATPDYQVRPLTQSRIQPVVSRAHPLSARQEVSLTEALAYPWVTPTIPDGMRQVLSETLLRDGAPESAFARLAALPDVRIEDLSACMHVAAQSLCIATTLASSDAETNLPGRLQLLPLDLGLTTHIAIITLRARTPSPLAARAMNLLAGSGPAISAANLR